MRRSSILSLLAGLGMVVGTGAFTNAILPQNRLSGARPCAQGAVKSCTRSIPSGRRRAAEHSTAPRTARRRAVIHVCMDAEGARVDLVKTEAQWHETVAAASESSSTLVLFFKKEFCRKCTAMKPKFVKLASEFSDYNVIWAEVDGVKLGKELREELGLKKVPSFHVWSKGRIMERFEAHMDLSKTVDQIRLLLEKYATPRSAVQLDNAMDLSLASQQTRSMQAPGASEVMGTGTIYLHGREDNLAHQEQGL